MMTERSLTAFYDLDVSPVSFDFAIFLAHMELERRRTEANVAHVVIVPSRTGEFRGGDTEYDTDNKRWRLHNILLPLCGTLPPPLSVTVCGTRGEAETIEETLHGAVFPVGYTTAQPVSAFMWSHIAAASARGEEIPSLRASRQARRSMKAWLDGHCGPRRPVTITLRESSHVAARNSNVPAWLEAAQKLDQSLYCPIFIRDTEKIFGQPEPAFDGVLTCSLASLQVDLRLALYELSWLNLGIPNGPTGLFWLNSQIRFLMFGMLNEDAAATSTLYVASQGLPHGGQLPHATPYQRLVWERDTADVIESEFSAMADRIGDDTGEIEASEDPANAEDPLQVALRLQMTGRLEEATSIYQQVVTDDPDNADAWHLLGIIAHQAGRSDAAEKMILRAIQLKPTQANYFINLSAVLKELGRPEEAVNALWRAIALAPGDAGAHADLAEMLHAQGENEKAKAALLKAIQLKPDSDALCERGARVLHALGHIEQAAGLYRRALDVRDRRRKDTQRMRESMPEVPVVTLTGG